MEVDWSVGEILSAIEDIGVERNTLVLFTSDNGPHIEGGHDPKFFDSNGPLRGHKRDLYEGGIRVPFVARWPGKIKPGTKTDLPVAMWDVLPTCLDIAGIEAPAGIDGISYLPELLGRTNEQKKHEYFYWIWAIRVGKWKLHTAGKNRYRLHDLEKDIAEKHDLADKLPEVVARCSKYFEIAKR